MLRSRSSSSVLRLNENTNVFHQKYIVALGGKKNLFLQLSICSGVNLSLSHEPVELWPLPTGGVV